MIPVILRETVFWFPVNGQDCWVAVHHLFKIDAIPNSMGQANDFRILIEILLGADNPRQKEGRVYGRDFGGAPSRARRGIDEVIIPAVFVYCLLGVVAKRGENPVACLRVRNPAALAHDAVAAQSEAGCDSRGGRPSITGLVIG